MSSRGRGPGQEPSQSSQNRLDIHGEFRLTLGGRPAASWATRSAKATRPARWNGERPAETTTKGSGATASVHSAGSDTSSPAGSYT